MRSGKTNNVALIFEGPYIRRKKKFMFTLLLIIIGITLIKGFFFFDYLDDVFNDEKYITQDWPVLNNDIERIDCSNKTLQQTTKCLYKVVNKIFIYNVTDDNLDLTFEDLQRRGGDCKDWTDFYQRNLNAYGFNQTERIRLFVEDREKNDSTIGVYHVFLVASDETGYCHLDMEDVFCFTYDNSTNSE